MAVIEPPAASSGIDIEQIPPSIWERFDRIRFLGRGGMGSVYRGWDKQLAREVAIKFVHGHDAVRFLREARAQAQISHDNVCKIYDVGFAEGQPYITMQLVRGEPLSSACKQMTLEEKIKVIREAAGALHEAHRLGLVHRDVKPSNILVERSDDGRWRPFVMDFGLARIVGEQGDTMTGHVAGTPAYMAPEQARGEIRSLDRRTDVYSLGATFYDILADRPPFVEEQAWKVLLRIETEEAPALRSVCPNIPADLETIVMKCLEREPARRYESARALGEDLQRYLDGEPVLARKASFWYRAVKRARKHKVLVSLVAAAFMTIATFVALGIRARRIAAEEARIAQELGEDVKEMQLFMRYAHSLPLHDIERERAVVRKRLADIESKMVAGGAIGRGAGHYAIGRGLLALQEPDKALEHLKAARAAGNASPELEYALGRALVEIYREQAESLRRIEDEQKRAVRQAEIDAAYKTPALAHLRAATGSRLEHPGYVEGLIALTEGRHQDALRLAKRASSEAPWFYEATLLEAEARYALGAEFKFDAKFDYDQMMVHFDPALDAYRRAIEVASSDPLVYEQACELFVQIVYSDVYAGRDAHQHFEEGKRVCNQAIVSSPSRGAGYLNRAWLHSAYYSADQMETADLTPRMLEVIEMAEEATRKMPNDALAHWLTGASWLNYLTHLGYLGFDTRKSTQRAMEEYNAALALDPSLLWAARELAYVYLARADDAELRGDEPFRDIENARLALNRAEALSPGSPSTSLVTSAAMLKDAQFAFTHGNDPASALAAHHRKCSTVLIASRDSIPARLDCSQGYALHAEYALALGEDPQPFIDEMWNILGVSNAEKHPLDTLIEYQMVTSARAKLARAESPIAELTSILGSARSEKNGALRKSSPARLLVVQWMMRQDTATDATFEDHLGALTPVLDARQIDPLPFQVAAAIHERHAAWRLAHREDPSDSLTKGFGMVAEALKRNPRFAPALVTRGDLYLVEARAAKDAPSRRKSAERAKEAFDAAISHDRYFSRQTETARAEVQRMLDTAAVTTP